MIDPRRYDAWIFDLDNTLYSAECALFAQIDARMTAYIQERLALDYNQARHLQKSYYVEYGTTMSGLMREHDVTPDHFMDYVHDIDLSVIQSNPSLRDAISRLPGKKLIYTNGSAHHAENVTGALGLTECFDGIFDIKAANYRPKPHAEPYHSMVEKFAITPARAVMFEDLAHNLLTPYTLGMTTVLIHSDAEWLQNEPDGKRPARRGDAGEHIHHTTDNITEFLKSIAGAQTSAAQQAT